MWPRGVEPKSLLPPLNLEIKPSSSEKQAGSMSHGCCVQCPPRQVLPASMTAQHRSSQLSLGMRLHTSALHTAPWKSYTLLCAHGVPMPMCFMWLVTDTDPWGRRAGRQLSCKGTSVYRRQQVGETTVRLNHPQKNCLLREDRAQLPPE
jgi:hypothetical protein